MSRYRFTRGDVAELAHIMGKPPEQITRADVSAYNRWLRRCAGSSLRRTFMPQRPFAVRPRSRETSGRRRRAETRSRSGDSGDREPPPADVARRRRASRRGDAQ